VLVDNSNLSKINSQKGNYNKGKRSFLLIASQKVTLQVMPNVASILVWELIPAIKATTTITAPQCAQ
jgi:hypothetical protein